MAIRLAVLALAVGDTYRLARTRGGLVLLIRAIREGFRVLHTHGIPLTPPKYRVLARLPEPPLVVLLRRGFATERAAVALASHANAARDEMQCLAFNIRRCLHLDTLASYDAPELMPHICAFDDRRFKTLPASTAWKRTTTLVAAATAAASAGGGSANHSQPAHRASRM